MLGRVFLCHMPWLTYSVALGCSTVPVRRGSHSLPGCTASEARGAAFGTVRLALWVARSNLICCVACFFARLCPNRCLRSCGRSTGSTCDSWRKASAGEVQLRRGSDPRAENRLRLGWARLRRVACWTRVSGRNDSEMPLVQRFPKMLAFLPKLTWLLLQAGNSRPTPPPIFSQSAHFAFASPPISGSPSESCRRRWTLPTSSSGSWTWKSPRQAMFEGTCKMGMKKLSAGRRRVFPLFTHMFSKTVCEVLFCSDSTP